MDRDAWQLLARKLAADVRYPNFKAEAAHRYTDKEFEDLLHDTWARTQR
jgi:hypothetical protein